MVGMLTQRQAQILRMFVSGMTYREIASALGLSTETINPSLKQSAKKLGAKGIGREKLRRAARRAGVDLEVAEDLEVVLPVEAGLAVEESPSV